jgi:site-specific DNA-methyltransferase (adenine-specific)
MSVTLHHGDCLDVLPTLGRPETWATIGAALKPGGYLLAFGAPRTYHRMACAIEDAGFVIKDTIAWVYGTGFPKRRNALKPAFEPIVMAYKPGGKRELQIDECRIHSDDAQGGEYRKKRLNTGASINKTGQWKQDREYVGFLEPGRWPANLCHDGSDEVLALFPQSKSLGHHPARRGGAGMWSGEGGGLNGNAGSDTLMDTGSAARFFFSAKAGAGDRWGSQHPTVKPVALLKWLVQLVTPHNGLVLDPFAGSGTTGVAALAAGRDCILIEQNGQYCADVRERLAFYEGAGSHSMQAKHRNRNVDHGPLFEAQP